MTRLEYLEVLAHARRILDIREGKPLAFTFSPGQIQHATQRWNSASDEERAEARALNDDPSVQ